MGGRTRLAWAVRVFSVCLVVRGGRAVCHAGTLRAEATDGPNLFSKMCKNMSEKL